MTTWEKLKYRIGLFFSGNQPPTLPPHGWSYYDHVRSIYLALIKDGKEDPRVAGIASRANSRPYGITWSDIFLLENVILELQGDDEVRRKAWMIRERFRETAGPNIYAQYTQSGIPDAAKCDIRTLRADLARLLDFLHWNYALVPIRERRRKALTMYCTAAVMLYLAALLVALNCLSSHNDRFVATTLTVIFCGVIGGFVSSQRRMQNLPSDCDPLISVFGLQDAGYYLWLSPLLGGIFAVVLSLLFMGEILKGTIFPDFAWWKAATAPSANRFAANWVMLPKLPLDYAKLFIWSFLAGFAEQLVPDSLDRLAAKLDTSKQAQVTPLSLPSGGTPHGQNDESEKRGVATEGPEGSKAGSDGEKKPKEGSEQAEADPSEGNGEQKVESEQPQGAGTTPTTTPPSPSVNAVTGAADPQNAAQTQVVQATDDRVNQGKRPTANRAS